MADKDFGLDFSEIQRYIIEAEAITSLAEEGLTKMSRASKILDEALGIMDGVESQIDSGQVLNRVLLLVYENVLEGASRILAKEAAKALRSSEEFRRSFYAERLLEACQNPESLILRTRGTGFSTRLLIENNLDSTAGDIEMWANAVEAVRADLGDDYSRSDPIKASRYWRNVIYGTARYNDTIESRLAAAESLASFWSILDLGNRGISMSSDWGGFPYPSKEGTYFVDSAIEKIQRSFADELTSSEQTYIEFLEKVRLMRATILRAIERVDDFAEEENITLGTELDRVEPPPRRDIVEKIEAHYGDTIAYADRSKIMNMVTDLRTLGAVCGYTVTKDKRVEVTLRGTGRRVRISVGVIERLLAEE